MVAVSHESKNILVAVAGQTPAIITETLWSLEQQRGIPIDEIRVITTSTGLDTLILKLLGKNGHFISYCKDFDIPQGRISFSKKDIFVLKDPQGTELDDIRTSEDNKAVADQIFSLMLEWTGREDEILYCSIAGGRKTLGIYLSMALMLCGRAQDSMSHVLVSPEFESGVPDFFYPPPRECHYRKFMGSGLDGQTIYEPISSSLAQVELADIPFPRLREMIGGEFPREKSLIEAISHSRILLSYLQFPPPLVVRMDKGLVHLGDFFFHLPRQLMAVYTFFLLDFNRNGGVGTIEDLFEKRAVLALIERRIDQIRRAEQERYAWESVRDLDDFRFRLGPCISKINGIISANLGKNRLSERYRITTGRGYGVNVAQVEILEGEEVPWVGWRR